MEWESHIVIQLLLVGDAGCSKTSGTTNPAFILTNIGVIEVDRRTSIVEIEPVMEQGSRILA